MNFLFKDPKEYVSIFQEVPEISIYRETHDFLKYIYNNDIIDILPDDIYLLYIDFMKDMLSIEPTDYDTMLMLHNNGLEDSNVIKFTTTTPEHNDAAIIAMYFPKFLKKGRHRVYRQYNQRLKEFRIFGTIEDYIKIRDLIDSATIEIGASFIEFIIDSFEKKTFLKKCSVQCIVTFIKSITYDGTHIYSIIENDDAILRSSFYYRDKFFKKKKLTRIKVYTNK